MLDNQAASFGSTVAARILALGKPTVMVDGPGPTLCFQRVPSRSYANNRVHLDVAVDDVAEWVERVVALGGRLERREPEYVVMKDPEGNQFCITPTRRS